MSDKTREEFEEVFPLPSKCCWSEKSSSYCWWSEKSSVDCWAVFDATRHPHDELWQVWLAAKEKYEPKTVEPFHVVLEPSDIEMILYQANMHLLPKEEGDEACAVGLQIGWSLGDDGEKQFGLNVYCFEYPEEGVIPLVEMEPPSTQGGGE